MRLTDYLRENGLTEDDIAQMSESSFSAEAVRKWRYGQRVPRAKHMEILTRITGGRVTANDFYAAAQEGAGHSDRRPEATR